MSKINRKVTIDKINFPSYQVSLIEKRIVDKNDIYKVYEFGYVLSIYYVVRDKSLTSRQSIERKIDEICSGKNLQNERRKYTSRLRKINLLKLFKEGYRIDDPVKLITKLLSLMQDN